jgi:hypothetical protein
VEACAMSQSTSDPDPPNQQHISFKWERTSRNSEPSWVGWLSIVLAVVGIILSILFGFGWL